MSWPSLFDRPLVMSGLWGFVWIRLRNPRGCQPLKLTVVWKAWKLWLYDTSSSENCFVTSSFANRILHFNPEPNTLTLDLIKVPTATLSLTLHLTLTLEPNCKRYPTTIYIVVDTLDETKARSKWLVKRKYVSAAPVQYASSFFTFKEVILIRTKAQIFLLWKTLETMTSIDEWSTMCQGYAMIENPLWALDTPGPK